MQTSAIVDTEYESEDSTKPNYVVFGLILMCLLTWWTVYHIYGIRFMIEALVILDAPWFALMIGIDYQGRHTTS